MKTVLRHTTALVVAAAALVATPALANNATVEKALKTRPELSSFYQGLVNTGVLAELKPDTTYTVFAPTNKAMARISQDKYPCFYSQQCSADVAEILRNHIVEKPIILGSGPDISAAYSINNTHLELANTSPSRNGGDNSVYNYMVDGARITRNTAMGAGQLYEINGVIADPQQMANVSSMKYVPATTNEVVLVPVPAMTKTTTNQVFYAPDGTPDGVSQTITTEVAPQ